MKAIHIRTDGMKCEHCPVFIRRWLSRIPGVADVGAYRSMHMTSVLYDPKVVRPEVLAEKLRRAGFVADVMTGQREVDPHH